MNAKETIINKTLMTVITQNGKRGAKQLDKNCLEARKVSAQLLGKLLKDNADTEYGRKYDFAHIHSLKEFKEKVPLSTYDDYAEYIERMTKNGETDLITVYPIRHYAVSSGSVGNPKNIPVSQETLDIYTKYSSNLMFYLIQEYKKCHPGIGGKPGKGLYALEVVMDQMSDGTPKGAISSTTMKQVRNYLPYLFTSPEQVLFPKGHMNMKYLKLRYALEEENLTFMAAAFMTALVDLMSYMKNNWEMLVYDIEHGTIDESIEMPDEVRQELQAGLTPNPKRAQQLRTGAVG